MSDSPSSNGRIRELDGLRALSVIFVILAHAVGAARIVSVPAALNQEVADLGALGVQVFFVISGFIITRLQMEERARTGTFSFLQFYIRRFFRIIPAYWTYLLVIVVLAAWGELLLSPIYVFRSLLFISNFWFPSFAEGWFCGHSWTLSVEEQYYVTFPFLMWVLLRGNRSWIIATLCFFYFLFVYSPRLGVFHINVSILPEYKYIVCGVLMALYWEKFSSSLKGISAVLPLLAFCFLFFRSDITKFSHVMDTYLILPMEAPVVAVIIAWVTQNPGPSAFLRWGLFQWLGKCSYSIYLWQQLYLAPASIYGKVRLSDPWYGPMLLLVSTCASYYLIERHMIRWGKVICSRIQLRQQRKPAVLNQPDAYARLNP